MSDQLFFSLCQLLYTIVQCTFATSPGRKKSRWSRRQNWKAFPSLVRSVLTTSSSLKRMPRHSVKKRSEKFGLLWQPRKIRYLKSSLSFTDCLNKFVVIYLTNLINFSRMLCGPISSSSTPSQPITRHTPSRRRRAARTLPHLQDSPASRPALRWCWRLWHKDVLPWWVILQITLISKGWSVFKEQKWTFLFFQPLTFIFRMS